MVALTAPGSVLQSAVSASKPSGTTHRQALPVQMAKRLAQLPGPGAKPTLTLDLTQNRDLWVTE